jgi:hypothetical protein
MNSIFKYQKGVGRPVLLLISATMLILGLTIWIPDYKDGLRPFMSWEVTEGKVIRADIVECNVGRHHVSMGPQLLFEYTVSGQQYSSDRFATGKLCASLKEVQNALASIKVNSTVPVYYNAKKPTYAVLSKDAPSGSIFSGWFVFLGFLIPLLMFKFSSSE